VLTSLLEVIEIRELKDKPQASPRISFLSDILKEYTTTEAFLSYFPEVILGVANEINLRYGEYFSLILMATKLAVPNQIAMSLALYLSDIRELA
jgi:hypothetical protein